MKSTMELKNSDIYGTGQLVYSNDERLGTFVVMCSGKQTNSTFRGMIVHRDDQAFPNLDKIGEIGDAFQKDEFVKFNGIVKLEQ